MGLNWFMPAFANRSVGSLMGSTGLDGLNVCACWDTKKSMNVFRTLELGHSRFDFCVRAVAIVRDRSKRFNIHVSVRPHPFSIGTLGEGASLWLVSQSAHCAARTQACALEHYFTFLCVCLIKRNGLMGISEQLKGFVNLISQHTAFERCRHYQKMWATPTQMVQKECNAFYWILPYPRLHPPATWHTHPSASR